MIEFSGKYSENSKNLIVKNNNIIAFVAVMIASLLYTVIILAIAIAFNEWLMTLLLSPMLFLIIYTLIYPHIRKEEGKNNILPTSITFDDENESIYVEFPGEQRMTYLSFYDIKRIIDLGDSYYIKLHFPKVIIFVCQKDLITQGTIEEFEEMFADKIIVKEK